MTSPSQLEREREILGDEIERIRQLLNTDLLPSDNESSNDEDEEDEEEANNDFIGKSLQYMFSCPGCYLYPTMRCYYMATLTSLFSLF